MHSLIDSLLLQQREQGSRKLINEAGFVLAEEERSFLEKSSGSAQGRGTEQWEL